MDSLPVKPGRGTKPERGPQKPDVVKSLEAIIRGTLGKSCKVEDFPADLLDIVVPMYSNEKA